MSEQETSLQYRQRLDLAAPNDLIVQASAQATALGKLIEDRQLYSMIQGRKYVKVEGWVPLARMNGVIPREVENVGETDGHYVARVQLVRIADGMVLTEASGECGGPDEPMWQQRPPHARRSMAATRATGKACRLAYSWVIALAGYEPTPAEEMDHVQATVTTTNAPPPVIFTVQPTGGDDWILPFGKDKGKSLRQIDNNSVKWWIGVIEKDINDPAKAKYKPANEESMRKLLHEKQRRAVMAAEAEADEKSDPNQLFADAETEF